MVKLELTPPTSPTPPPEPPPVTPPNLRRVPIDGAFNGELINQIVHEYPPLRRPRYMPDIVRLQRIRLQSEVQSSLNNIVRLYVQNIPYLSERDSQDILREATALALFIEERVQHQRFQRGAG
jgi:hypothetical protein